MKIAILDDYQNVVPGLDCYKILDGHEVKVFNNSARGVGQLAIRLAGFDALVLIRERTAFPAALLNKLPNLKLISQTGKVSGHVDVAAASARGIAIAEGIGSPIAPAWDSRVWPRTSLTEFRAVVLFSPSHSVESSTKIGT